IPDANALPEPLRPLVRRQSVRLTHEQFNPGADKLVRSLQEVVRPTRGPTVVDTDRGPPKLSRFSVFVFTVLSGVIALFFTFALMASLLPSAIPPNLAVTLFTIAIGVSVLVASLAFRSLRRQHLK